MRNNPQSAKRLAFKPEMSANTRSSSFTELSKLKISVAARCEFSSGKLWTPPSLKRTFVDADGNNSLSQMKPAERNFKNNLT